MEEGVNFIVQICETSQLDSSFSSSSSQTSLNDHHTHLINALIASKRPIFVVSCGKNDNRMLQFSRQEMLKQKILNYNRKEKSLEELSKKFIENFEGRDGIMLELDKVTVQLKVERRRIYDIVNIFQSLQVVKKAAKNNYVWRGLKEAIQTITTISQSNCDYSSLTSKKEKSLENLAARFLKLFIFSIQPITLQEAAKVLIHTEDSALIKTKIRRLYDIVNVFKSIGIVSKVHLPSKKPGFQWLGVKMLAEVIKEKKEKCSQLNLNRCEVSQDRENNQVLANRQNVNDWFSIQQHKRLLQLGFMNNFSQKVFEPSILKRTATTFTLACSSQSFSDICAQY